MEKQFGSINSIIEEQEKQIVKLQAENKWYEKALREIENKKLMWEPDEMVSSLKKIATEALTKGKEE